MFTSGLGQGKTAQPATGPNPGAHASLGSHRPQRCGAPGPPGLELAALDVAWGGETAERLEVLAEPAEVCWARRSELSWN
jgi:hypothetical protein